MTRPPPLRVQTTSSTHSTQAPEAEQTPREPPARGAASAKPAAFVARTPYEPAHPHALAIYCSDGRFTNAVEELLHHVGHERLDTLTMPGGPGLLNLWSAMFSEMDAVTRGASFLIAGHGITHAVLLAHEGCGYYRRRYSAQSPEQIRARQWEDLRVAARLLRQAHPDLKVSLYFARPDGGRVCFDAVAPEAEGVRS